MNLDLKSIGSRCKTFRTFHGYTQTVVAMETGYSIENISSFECGRNDNARILLWYLTKGMTVPELLEDGEISG